MGSGAQWHFSQKGREAPSPFRQNILQQFHGGAGVLEADVACSARHSCLPPTSSAATARERRASSQRLLLQEATAQSQLSGWTADTSLSVLCYFTPGPAQDPLEKGGESRVSSLRSSCPVQWGARQSPFVCASLSAFSIAADVALHVMNSTEKKSLDSV